MENLKDLVVANYPITASDRKVYQVKEATCKDFLQGRTGRKGYNFAGYYEFLALVKAFLILHFFCITKCIAKCNILI